MPSPRQTVQQSFLDLKKYFAAAHVNLVMAFLSGWLLVMVLSPLTPPSNNPRVQNAPWFKDVVTTVYNSNKSNNAVYRQCIMIKTSKEMLSKFQLSFLRNGQLNSCNYFSPFFHTNGPAQFANNASNGKSPVPTATSGQTFVLAITNLANTSIPATLFSPLKNSGNCPNEIPVGYTQIFDAYQMHSLPCRLKGSPHAVLGLRPFFKRSSETRLGKAANILQVPVRQNMKNG
jgi:hypothetical protein